VIPFNTKISIISFALILFKLGSALANNDTLKVEKALVVYGDKKKFETEKHSLQKLDNILDSLLSVEPFDEVAYEHYRALKLSYLKTEEELAQMIEDFFNKPEVPIETINEINRYIALRELSSEIDEKTEKFAQLFACDPYPASGIYGNNWDTSKPVVEYTESWVTLQLSELPIIEPEQDCNFVMPHEGMLTSPFGWRYGRNHNGIDIGIRNRDPIKAAFDGVVRYSGYYGSFGRVIVIRHYNGLETLYAHLHKNNVQSGDYVSAGDIIGLGGSTGRSTGPHLHFETRFLGQPVNPRIFIDTKTKQISNNTLNLTDWRTFENGKLIHKVAPGESLSKIAQRYGTDVSTLCKANNLSVKSIIRPGQKLVVYAKK
jgi:murein DD-endopeptidase MepM/ murein hydrolase activator NlpD